ncbi:hypothetical protein HPY86_05630 [candidate division WOR-3 bacterium]|nr:hypothetical protein [candidate division WOR-3 bacterium]
MTSKEPLVAKYSIVVPDHRKQFCLWATLLCASQQFLQITVGICFYAEGIIRNAVPSKIKVSVK